MKVSELEQNRSLVPLELPRPQRDIRRQFIRAYCQNLLAERSAAPPTRASERPQSLVIDMEQLGNLMARTEQAFRETWQRISKEIKDHPYSPEYPDSHRYDRHLHPDSVYSWLEVEYKWSAKGVAIEGFANVTEMRKQMVYSIVWRAVAQDPSLVTDAQKAGLLDQIVDRRLRTAEQMLYSVGLYLLTGKKWENCEEIRNTGGAAAWKDGVEGIFEYPEADGRCLVDACSPDTTGRCSSQHMQDWEGEYRPPEPPEPEEERDDESFVVMIDDKTKVNDAAIGEWGPCASYRHELAPGADFASAIEGLFKPQQDFKARNLLLCDHVIHVVHLEALLFTKKKFSLGMRDLELLAITPYTDEEDIHHSYISIGSPWTEWLTRGRTPDELVDPNTDKATHIPKFFNKTVITEEDLQIGDHLRFFNHPAFDNASDSAWRMENVVLIRTAMDPQDYLYMGHGLRPMKPAQIRERLIYEFQSALHSLREKADDAGSATEISLRTGATLWKAASGKRPIPQSWWPPYSKAVSDKRDWWLRWRVELGNDRSKYEANAVKTSNSDSDLKRNLWDDQKLVYRPDPDGQHPNDKYWSGWGYFPLWEPRLFNGQPVTNDSGCVSDIEDIQPTDITRLVIGGRAWFTPLLDILEWKKFSVIRPWEQ